MTPTPAGRTDAASAAASAARNSTAMILASLPTGVTLFALVTFWVRQTEPMSAMSNLATVWLVVTIASIGAAVVVWQRLVRPLIPASGHRSDATKEEMSRLQTGLIICMAVLEGAALLGVLTHFLGGGPLPSVASVALMWGGLLVLWPRRGWYGLR